MSNSIAITLDLTCAQCGKAFSTELWLIIAPDERPDLVEQIQNDMLHEGSCPACGHIVHPEAPLLVFQPASTTPIIFSPAQSTTASEDQAHFQWLLDLLQTNLGNSWQDVWLEQEPLIIDRASLPAVLDESSVPLAILDSLQALITANSWQEKRQVLAMRPDLLGPDVDRLFSWLLGLEQAGLDENLLNTIERQRLLLRLCREIGVEQAILLCQTVDEIRETDTLLLRFLNADDWHEKRRLLEEYPTLLSDSVERQLMVRLETVQDKVEYVVLEWNLALVRRCRTMDIDQAFVETIGRYYREEMAADELPNAAPELRYLLEALYGEQRETGRGRRIKLYELALHYMEREQRPLLWAELQMGLADTCLLANALADMSSLTDASSPKPRAHVLVAPSLTEDETQLELAVHHYQQALQVFTPENSPANWCAAHSNLATAYTRRQSGTPRVNLEHAAYHYEQALQGDLRKEQRAGLHYNLAQVYDSLVQEGQEEKLERFIDHCQQALPAFTRERHPAQWFDIHCRLGVAYQRRTQGDSDENREQAVHHFAQALTVPPELLTSNKYVALLNGLVALNERTQNIEQAIFYAEQAMQFDLSVTEPSQWALTRCLLASAYSKRSQGDLAENIEQAITYYQEALPVYPQKANPETWGQIQFDLARAYTKRVYGDPVENNTQAIAHFRNALTVYTQTITPKQWAETHTLLGNLFSQRHQGNERDNVESAIFHYEAALQVYTAQTDPELWLACHNNLAAAYLARSWQDQDENAKQARACCEHALQIATQENFASLWASLQHNLAKAIIASRQGDRAANIEKAIHHNQLALTILTAAANPEDWATTHQNIASAYHERPRGSRHENVECAITHSEQALQIYTEQAYPMEWARIQHNLGIAYQDRLVGTRSDNLERAIRHCQAAFRVYTVEEFPEDWARTQNTLADAYQDRMDGKHAENMEYKIHLHQAVLTVVSQKTLPTLWAETYLKLALAFKVRPLGNRAENLESAIEHGEVVFKIYTKESHPEEWAAAKDHLSTLYVNRLRGNLADNLERAIRYCEDALSVFTHTTSPRQWASVHNDLAFAYNDRLYGDRAENIERAIDHGEQAQRVFTKETFPEEWAMVQLNLAKSYAIRVRGNRVENQDCAISHWKNTLEVNTKEIDPKQWALTHYNLAHAYNQRRSDDNDENQQYARQHVEQSLTVYTRENHPVDWARSQDMLARIYGVGKHRAPGEEIERAIYHYQQALLVRIPDALPVDWADTQNNLALIYSIRFQGDPAENLQQAMQGFTQALQVYDPTIFPEKYCRTQNNLAKLHFQQANWAEAAAAYQHALEAAEILYSAAITPEARRSELREIQEMPAHLVYALAQANSEVPALEQAVVWLERNRARWLSEALALQSTRPLMIPDAIWTRFIAQSQAIQALRAEAQLPDHGSGKRDFLTLAEELRRTQEQLNKTIAEIRGYDTDFMPDTTFAEIQQIAHDVPLIYLMALPQQGLALVVHRGGVSLVWLDTDEIQRTVEEQSPDLPLGAHIEAPESQVDNLSILLKQFAVHLGRRFMRPLASSLQKLAQTSGQIITAVTLIPVGDIGIFPWHAGWIDDEITFHDAYLVRYAPSAHALHAAQQRPPNPTPQLLALGNPTGIATQTAFFTDWLAEQVYQAFPKQTALLLHAAATIQTIQERLSSQPPAHLLLGCHGIFDRNDPLQSGLELADGRLKLLTLLSELQLRGVDLVCLCACETAVTEVTLTPNEALGLPAGFLQAGARSVIATLWPVEALPTVLLLRHFYQKIADRMPAHTALRSSIKWLRTLSWREFQRLLNKIKVDTHYDPVLAFVLDRYQYDPALQKPAPFDAPIYWAAFTYTGAFAEGENDDAHKAVA